MLDNKSLDPPKLAEKQMIFKNTKESKLASMKCFSKYRINTIFHNP